MSKATILWVDLEMTGLVPGTDKILEIAAVATDWNLETVAEFTAVVKVPETLMKERMVGGFWEKNHESRDGLMVQNADGEEMAKVEEKLLAWISENFARKSIKTGKYGEKIILAGNSIHQDRKFIDIEMPKLSEKLHYRMLDVSAWKVYFEGKRDVHFSKREAHRALDDIYGSIEEFKFYTEQLK